MKTIERYINFAIDNGYTVKDYFYKKKLHNIRISWRKNIRFNWQTSPDSIYNYFSNKTTNLYELITSKEFIEAIARGLLKTQKWNYVYFDWGFEFVPKWDNKQWLRNITNRITASQAFAIRDKYLERFIEDLLPKENTWTTNN